MPMPVSITDSLRTQRPPEASKRSPVEIPDHAALCALAERCDRLELVDGQLPADPEDPHILTPGLSTRKLGFPTCKSCQSCPSPPGKAARGQRSGPRPRRPGCPHPPPLSDLRVEVESGFVGLFRAFSLMSSGQLFIYRVIFELSYPVILW